MSESFVAQVIADGRITIPLPLRRLLSIKEGDFVKIQLEGKTEPVKEEA